MFPSFTRGSILEKNENFIYFQLFEISNYTNIKPGTAQGTKFQKRDPVELAKNVMLRCNSKEIEGGPYATKKIRRIGLNAEKHQRGTFIM